MQVMVVRHAQSTGNAAIEEGRTDEHAKATDPWLTPLGVSQADALAAWPGWDQWRPQRLFSSLLVRTIQTAAPLAERLDLPIEARDDLFECGGPANATWDGPGPGMARSALQAVTERVVLPATSTEEGWWAGPLEEPWVAMGRALTAARWLQELDAERVAVVCHGGFGAMLINALVNPEATEAVAARAGTGAEDLPLCLVLDNTSTSLIDVAPGRPAWIGWVNRVDHLAAGSSHRLTRPIAPWPPRPPQG